MGVLLTPGGLPPAVARAALAAGGGGGLVAALVAGPGAAKRAAAAGAGALVLAGGGNARSAGAAVAAVRGAVIASASVPIILDASPGAAFEAVGADLAACGADGAAVGVEGVAAAVASLRGDSSVSAADPPTTTTQPPTTPLSALAAAASPDVVAVRAAERDTLTRALRFLRRATPSMAEASVLAASLAALDDPFLVVVAGEFNAGKSTLINALLGGRHLEEGVLPTTNEVTLLVHETDPRVANGDTTADTNSGVAVRGLNAPLLRSVHIVDTPGTNAVITRQSRLAEEFVPRADLILFAMSADRPFCESEAGFLRYMRTWGKKVAFVVNKIDALPSPADADAVAAFVADSAGSAAGVAVPVVLPVSARTALAAKEAVAGDARALAARGDWASSRFGDLEAFVASFLAGGVAAADGVEAATEALGEAAVAVAADSTPLRAGAAPGEGVRLKLDTPLYVGGALLAAAADALDARVAAADADVAAVASVSDQVRVFADGMRRDGTAQRAAVVSAIDRGMDAVGAAIDAALSLANVEGLLGYVLGRGGGSDSTGGAAAAPGLAAAAADLASLVADHGSWLASNAAAQIDNYRSFASRRGATLGVDATAAADGDAAADAALAAVAALAKGDAVPVTKLVADGRGVDARDAVIDVTPELNDAALTPSTTTTTPLSTTTAADTVAAFDVSAASVLLDAELRESAAGTAAGVAVAALLGAALTAVLPTFAEDALALALAAAVGYLALLNLPLRRADVKGKARRAASNFAAAVETGLARELEAVLAAVAAAVGALVAPLAAAASARATAARSDRAECETLAEEVADLRRRAAGVARE